MKKKPRAAVEIKEGRKDISMDSVRTRVTGAPLQLGIISLEENLVATYVLSPDEDLSFFFFLAHGVVKMQHLLHLWER